MNIGDAMPTDVEIEESVQLIVKYEGVEIQEAKLSYKARQDLPDSAFCGPKRTYPAHDAAHVGNAFARIARFGGRMPPAVRTRILACLRRRAKRFGVEHEPIKWERKVEETVAITEWYLKEIGVKK